jgi:predicted signal transduction protein with EAL and GGDEF domain
VQVGVSIGAVTGAARYDDAEELFQDADMLMYQAKGAEEQSIAFSNREKLSNREKFSNQEKSGRL